MSGDFEERGIRRAAELNNQENRRAWLDNVAHWGDPWADWREPQPEEREIGG